MDRRVESFRRGASRVVGSGTGRRYSAALRATAVDFARAEVAAGGSVSGAASALGVPMQTLTYWISKSPVRAELVPVHVVETSRVRADDVGGAVTVTLPNGIVVAGLCVDEALAVVRGLR